MNNSYIRLKIESSQGA